MQQVTSTLIQNVSASQIKQGGAILNQSLLWNGTVWAPGDVIIPPLNATGGQALVYNSVKHEWLPHDIFPSGSNGNVIAYDGNTRTWIASAFGGSSGPIGPQGMPGPVGPIGLTGPTGPIGPQGAKGDTGATGAPGTLGVTYAPVITTKNTVAGVAVYTILGYTNNLEENYLVYLDGIHQIPVIDYVINTNTITLIPTPVDSNIVLNVLAFQNSVSPRDAVGPAGPQGMAGPQGPEGSRGPVGPQGPIGLTGSAGPTGATGARGLTGTIGLTGPMGVEGPVGPIGLTGPRGLTGATGPKGDSGFSVGVFPLFKHYPKAFYYTGSVQTFTVPSDVERVFIVALGAGGASTGYTDGRQDGGDTVVVVSGVTVVAGGGKGAKNNVGGDGGTVLAKAAAPSVNFSGFGAGLGGYGRRLYGCGGSGYGGARATGTGTTEGDTANTAGIAGTELGGGFGGGGGALGSGGHRGGLLGAGGNADEFNGYGVTMNAQYLILANQGSSYRGSFVQRQPNSAADAIFLGSGGAQGGVSYDVYGGGGGGCAVFFIDVTPGSSISVTIGKGGITPRDVTSYGGNGVVLICH